jgi:hypothetical protein
MIFRMYGTVDAQISCTCFVYRHQVQVQFRDSIVFVDIRVQYLYSVHVRVMGTLCKSSVTVQL